MPRARRIEFPGAIYYIMNRGNRGELIFRDDQDYRQLLETLGEACYLNGWIVHAFSLLPGQFLLVLETPNANLGAGMKWFHGTFISRFNHRHKTFGHLFGGRYKSLVVDESSGGYLRTVCDYVHLRPTHAALLPSKQPLWEFPWSSWPAYLKPPAARPRWLRVGRLLDAYGIASDSEAGRIELEQRMEHRRLQQDGDEFKALGRGWCIGSETFRQELREKFERKANVAPTDHHTSPERVAHPGHADPAPPPIDYRPNENRPAL